MNDNCLADDDDDFDLPDLDNMAAMPDGAMLCLCGRDGNSQEVLDEMAKAAALTSEFGIGLGGCLKDAAAACDTIRQQLKPGPARKLGRAIKAERAFLNDMQSMLGELLRLIEENPQNHH